MATPEMHPVTSSAISHVGHDGDALHVTFTSGKTYRYAGAPVEHLNQMLNSSSPGSYFAKNIRSSYAGEPQY